MHREVCECGYDAERNTFTQSYGSRTLDAATLMIPLVGFLPPDDPRVVGTVEAIQRELMADGYVLRYDSAEADDGLPPGEGAFLPCSFWLADCLTHPGRRDEARALFVGSPGSPTTSACWPRSTTRIWVARSGTSRRRSPTSGSSTPH